jgi:hypothetical protein
MTLREAHLAALCYTMPQAVTRCNARAATSEALGMKSMETAVERMNVSATARKAS